VPVRLVSAAVCALGAHALLYGTFRPGDGMHGYFGWYEPALALAAVSDPPTWENDAVAAFFDNRPPPPESSPFAGLPLGVPQILVHGTADDVVPFEQSERYVARAGGEAELVPLEGAGHFEPIDPLSPEWTATRDAVHRLLA